MLPGHSSTGWDVCLCGAFDLDNGSVVCWVCEEPVIRWTGSLTATTLPGHER